MTFTFHCNPRNSNHRAWGLLRDLPSQQSVSPHNRQGSGSQGRLRPRVGSISGLSLAAATRALCSVRSEIPPRGLRGLRRTPRPSQHRTAPRGWRGMERNPGYRKDPRPTPGQGCVGPRSAHAKVPGTPKPQPGKQSSRGLSCCWPLPVPVVDVGGVRPLLHDPAWVSLTPLGHQLTYRTATSSQAAAATASGPLGPSRPAAPGNY